MFGQTKESTTKKKKANADLSSSVTILTSGCHFHGKLYCRGSSRIGGRIEGQVISEGLLIIEEDAIIQADIKADEAIIQGQVRGKLEAAGRVELCASSRFDGDISSPVLVISEGAQFNGRSSMLSAEGVPVETHQEDIKTLAAQPDVDFSPSADKNAPTGASPAAESSEPQPSATH